MTNSKTNNIKWLCYEIHNIITKSEFGNIQIINMMVYVSFFIMYNPYLLKDIILVSQKIVISQEK